MESPLRAPRHTFAGSMHTVLTRNRAPRPVRVRTSAARVSTRASEGAVMAAYVGAVEAAGLISGGLHEFSVLLPRLQPHSGRGRRRVSWLASLRAAGLARP